MSIYTKTGDDGTTGLFGGGRLSKADEIIEAYGSLDEVTALLGMITTFNIPDGETSLLFDIQHDLYGIMGALSNAPVDLQRAYQRTLVFEKHIDAIQSMLPELQSFVYPRGSQVSVWCHIARSVCRRAERELVRAKLKRNDEMLDQILVYINRLSDYLFALGRLVNVGDEEKIDGMFSRPPRKREVRPTGNQV